MNDNDEFVDHAPIDPIGILIDKRFKRTIVSNFENDTNEERYIGNTEIENMLYKYPNLHNVIFENVTFFNVLFFKGKLINVKFINCKMYNVEFCNKPELDISFDGCYFINCIMYNCNTSDKIEMNDCTTIDIQPNN